MSILSHMALVAANLKPCIVTAADVFQTIKDGQLDSLKQKLYKA